MTLRKLDCFICLFSKYVPFLVGQEPETINYDGDVVITPFNMREELEEDGHFDASGTFVFKRVGFISNLFHIFEISKGLY